MLLVLLRSWCFLFFRSCVFFYKHSRKLTVLPTVTACLFVSCDLLSCAKLSQADPGEVTSTKAERLFVICYNFCVKTLTPCIFANTKLVNIQRQLYFLCQYTINWKHKII